MNPTKLRTIIQNSIEFVEKEEYLSFDPFDALTSPIIERITANNAISRRIATQLNARLLLSFRFLGMKRMMHTKTISDMPSAYSLLANHSGEEEHLLKAAKMRDFKEVEFFDSTKTTKEKFSGEKGHVEEMEKVVEALKTGKQVLIPFEELILTTLTLFKALESLKEGKVKKIEF